MKKKIGNLILLEFILLIISFIAGIIISQPIEVFYDHKIMFLVFIIMIIIKLWEVYLMKLKFEKSSYINILLKIKFIIIYFVSISTLIFWLKELAYTRLFILLFVSIYTFGQILLFIFYNKIFLFKSKLISYFDNF